MIVDVHTHTPTHRDAVPPEEHSVNERWRRDRAVVASNTWDDYDRAAADVDVSVAFNIAVPDPLAATGIPTDPARVNDSTAEFVAAAPERRIGFMSVDPLAPDALDEIVRCTDDLGLQGIKLAPNYQDFDPFDKRARAVFRHAERSGLPVIMHQGASPVRTAPLRYAHPLLADELAIEFPELRLILAHMGHPWQPDAAVVIRKHPHLYADVSALFVRPWGFYQAMVAAMEWGVLDKLLFASDFPISTPAETLAGLRAVNAPVEGTGLPRIPDDAIEGIIHRDSLALLGLELGGRKA